MLVYTSASNRFKVTIPQLTPLGVPTKKLPHCPACHEDELGVLNPDIMMCYSCSTYFYYRRPIVSEEAGS